MIAFNPWVDVKDQAPPYDELVLLKGIQTVICYDGEELKLPQYALAFNQCYPPHMCMTQLVATDADADLKTRYPEIAFDITHWTRIPE